ncbi:MAG: hypothetical protein CVU03_05850 [Bacteroidetes bacterium HGW-Bacteroidetes-2]|jgi:plasmid stabilization system protein ParE|nr:MAG: hypothetical protein CVU03_05850 [Bacteroidetes bacterium HGW-Bacteroidetes-2]
MKYRLLLSDEASWDIKEAYDYYAEIPSENLETRFLQNLEEGLNYITINPKKLAVKYKQSRICNLTQFPYQIHFTIEKNTILVFGVFHGKRNPKSWTKRK